MSALQELEEVKEKKGLVLSLISVYFKLYPVGLEREEIKGWVEFSQPQEEKALNLSVKTKK